MDKQQEFRVCPPLFEDFYLEAHQQAALTPSHTHHMSADGKITYDGMPIRIEKNLFHRDIYLALSEK